MKKYEYTMRIDYYYRRLVNDDIDIQTCKLMISNEIMAAWNDSQVAGEDMYNILRHSDGIFQEIAERIKRKEK